VSTTTLGRLSALAVAALVAAPEGAAGQRTLACPYDREAKHVSIRTDTDDRTWQVKWAADGCSVDMRTRGEVTFARDLSDVEQVARGGRFVVTERVGRAERILEITPSAGGDLDRQYTVDGDEREFDADAQAWLAALLVDVERRTAFSAKSRVPKLYRERGARGVLDEIARLRGDYPRRVYYQELFALDPRLDQETLRGILRQAGRELSSDYEKAELLIGMSKRKLVDAGTQQAYVEAVGSIGSDYERRRALTPLLKEGHLEPAVVRAMLETAGRIGSDYELAELLIDVSQRYAVDREASDAFFDAVASIESDYEHRRVLSALLKRGARDKEIVRRLLESAKGIDSDYELAELLIAVSAAHPIDDELRPAYMKAADTIGSDHEFRRVLSALRKNGNL
jgi:hypothetical protein